MVLHDTAQRLRVVDTLPAHADAILRDVRHQDRAEWVCGLGAPFEKSLRAGISEGLAVRTALGLDGEPIAIWGLGPALPEDPNVRSVWLAASVRAERLVLSFHKVLSEELWRLHSVSTFLYCFADKRNRLHIRWLERIGFIADSEHPTGPLWLPYILFWRHP